MALNFLALSGSLRAQSYNTSALRAAAELAPDGMTIAFAGIGDIPLYNDDIRAAGYRRRSPPCATGSPPRPA